MIEFGVVVMNWTCLGRQLAMSFVAGCCYEDTTVDRTAVKRALNMFCLRLANG